MIAAQPKVFIGQSPRASAQAPRRVTCWDRPSCNLSPLRVVHRVSTGKIMNRQQAGRYFEGVAAPQLPSYQQTGRELIPSLGLGDDDTLRTRNLYRFCFSFKTSMNSGLGASSNRPLPSFWAAQEASN